MINTDPIPETTLESEARVLQEHIDALDAAIKRKYAHRAKLVEALNKKKKAIKAERAAVRFLSCEDGHNMGLHNKPCPNPYAFCRLHGVWLAYEQVRSRRCVMKPAGHGLLKPCKHLADGPPTNNDEEELDHEQC